MHMSQAKHNIVLGGFRSPIPTSGFGAVGVVNGAEGQLRYDSVETSWDPETQVEQTMPLIRQYAAEDARHPLIKDVAHRYRAAMPGAHTSEIAWRAARNHLTFVDDQSIAASAAPGIGDAIIEVLRRPADVAYQYQITGERVPGDCDDHSMFSAAVARALDPDIDIRFVCIAASPQEPGVLSHIYVSIGGVPCDASHGEYPGWEAPTERVSRRVEYSLDHHIGVMALVSIAVAVTWYVFGPWIRQRIFA